jgi:hypothetical protein
MKARVHNGRFVVEQATDLPEGTEVELMLIDGDDLDEDDRRLLHEALVESEEDLIAGRIHSAASVMAEVAEISRKP